MRRAAGLSNCRLGGTSLSLRRACRSAPIRHSSSGGPASHDPMRCMSARATASSESRVRRTVHSETPTAGGEAGEGIVDAGSQGGKVRVVSGGQDAAVGGALLMQGVGTDKDVRIGGFAPRPAGLLCGNYVVPEPPEFFNHRERENPRRRKAASAFILQAQLRRPRFRGCRGRSLADWRRHSPRPLASLPTPGPGRRGGFLGRTCRAAGGRPTPKP
jgi:hypothetical protein